MSQVVLVSEYAALQSTLTADISLRISLDAPTRAVEYERSFMEIVARNPQNIAQLIIYGQFDDEDSYGFADLLATVFQHCSKLTSVRILEINSVRLDHQLSLLLCKVIGTLEQRMLLFTIRLLNCQLGSQQTLKIIACLKANTNVRTLDVSSNNCGDSVFPLLLENMTKFEQNLTGLGFSHNNISDAGVQILASTISSQKVFISDLYLSHNPQISADGIDALFVCAMRCNRLKTLSLAGCSLAHAYWARFLPFIRSLHTLDLSHNQLDDDALIVLGHCLSHNTSVTMLNLSHNRFLTYGSHIFETLLSTNACLQSISIASNPIRDKSIWKSLGLGLSMNRVLTSLDLADTALTLDDLHVIGLIAFQHNTTLRHINVEDNFLPSSVAKMDSFYGDEDADIRSFLQTEFPDTCNDLLPLSAAAEVESANASLLWIQDIREKVKASIEVNAIVDVTTGELRRQSEEEPIASDDPEYFDRKMYHPDVVQHSSYYATPEYLRDRIVRDMQELYSTFFAHLVYIAWGRAEFVLGAIDIDVHLTFGQLRPKVIPFVQEYMSTVALTEQDDSMNFSILSATGDVTDQSSFYQNRSVWADVRHTQPAPTVVLRPANWIRLSD